MFALVLFICYPDGGCEDIVVDVYDNERRCLVAMDDQRIRRAAVFRLRILLMVSGSPPANTAILSRLLQLYRGQFTAEYRPRINVMLIIAIITLLQRRVAKPKVVRSTYCAMPTSQMVHQALSAPQHLLRIYRLLPTIGRRRVVGVGHNMAQRPGAEFDNQRR